MFSKHFVIGDFIPKDEVSSALKELYVHYSKNDGFGIPKAIINHYRIDEDAGLLCTLVELKTKSGEKKKIGKDVLVDVVEEGTETDFSGYLQSSIVDLYQIPDDCYILFILKKVISS